MTCRHLFVLGVMLVALNLRPTSSRDASVPHFLLLLSRCPHAIRQSTLPLPSSLQYSKLYKTLTKQDLGTHTCAAASENSNSPDSVLNVFRKQVWCTI